MSKKDQSKFEIGKRIKQLRLMKGFTIQELADKAGMSAGYLSEAERGGPELSGSKLGALATPLATTVDYLLTGTGSPPQESTETLIPGGLAEAAEMLNWSYSTTARLLAGKRSLVAERRNDTEDEWTAQSWMDFHEKVAPYL